MSYVSMRPTAFHVYRKPAPRNETEAEYHLWAKTSSAEAMRARPEPRPVQRIPAYVPTAEDIARESRQIFYGQLIHDGMDEEAAYQATVAHFAIQDHALIGAIRNEE